MSLQTNVGYPVGIAAAVVGLLRQSQRWLPRYEWVLPQQLPTYVAGINLSALLVGIVGVFAVGIRADRKLEQQWTILTALGMSLLSAVAGLGIGTALTFFLHPGFNTVTIRPLTAFLGPMAAYVVSEGVPIGVAGVAGLAVSRVHAIDAVEAASADADSDTDSDSERLSIAEAGSRFR